MDLKPEPILHLFRRRAPHAVDMLLVLFPSGLLLAPNEASICLAYSAAFAFE